MKRQLALLLWVVSLTVFAFPENSRHGYANCTTCHVSPNGGGLLTPYGRSLSNEVLSTWGTEEETPFLYGAFKMPEWLNLLGDLRAIQTYRDTATVTRAKFIFMQADLEAGVRYGKTTVVATVGRQDSMSFNHSPSASILSRRHYLHYQATDYMTVRAGKFFPAVGINFPDHFQPTRRDLGFDEGGETYNAELGYQGDSFDAYVTGIFGRPEDSALNKDSGLGLRGSVFLADTHKVGLSYFGGVGTAAGRHFGGPFFVVSFLPSLYVMGEVDVQRQTTGVTGMVDYARLNFEPYKGVNFYLTQEFSKLDFKDPLNVTDAYGVGFQWFPRPHMELNSLFQKRRAKAVSNDFTTFAWVLFHYYL